MKTTAISIIVSSLFIGGIIIFLSGAENSQGALPQERNNVTVIDGKQIITIDAKGGYVPRVTSAKAGIPTVIKINTQATFDCSAALAIPSLGYSKNLPPSGETNIEVPPQKPGAVIRGLCAMGMYNFSVDFN